MIARAPGKLFTTGAYAILEGAPAIVMAVDRYVTARTSGPPSGRPEVVEVARRLGATAPAVDVSELERGGRKLGLGSSAAAAVAATAVLLGPASNPCDPSTRRRIFDEALRAHAAVQPRGSGADVAAATFGGVVRVQRMGDDLSIEQVTLPRGLAVAAFALDRSARTSDALDRLALRRSEAAAALRALIDAALAGDAATRADDARGFVEAAARHVAGLRDLGRALDLALLPDEVTRARDLLSSTAGAGTTEEFVLLPSGAGGGDTVLWLSARGPTDEESATLERAGLHRLDLALDNKGVHSPSGEGN